MTFREIVLLKDIILSENISVVYHSAGKCYITPVPSVIAAILTNWGSWTKCDSDDYVKTFISCTYKTILGTQFMECTIYCGESNILIERTLVPLQPQQQNSHHRDLMSLVNACSRRIIAQEISRNKYAIATAASANAKQIS